MGLTGKRPSIATEERKRMYVEAGVPIELADAVDDFAYVVTLVAKAEPQAVDEDHERIVLPTGTVAETRKVLAKLLDAFLGMLREKGEAVPEPEKPEWWPT